MNWVIRSKILDGLNNVIQHYNHKKYWKFQEYVIGRSTNKPTLLRYYYYFRIKRMESKNGASSGTRIGVGVEFKSEPYLPHGIKGIFLHPYSKIGERCTIFHHVTIGFDGKDVDTATVIGDNCIIGAGAKIIGRIKIGNNVRIGANCVVVTDVPDNATVVLEKPRIIIRNDGLVHSDPIST